MKNVAIISYEPSNIYTFNIYGHERNSNDCDENKYLKVGVEKINYIPATGEHYGRNS